ncbi:MAG: M13-type metalloendopeptidase [Pseudomonadales bacterium]|nr:M13-type metalloendopeptidase [Pseudomonadales bacterium]
MRIGSVLIVTCLLLSLGCSPREPDLGDENPAIPSSGLETSHVDITIRPGDDFYRYVNGTWLQTTEIPADRSNYGSFSALADAAQDQLRSIIEAAAATNAPVGSDTQKVGDFYKSFMDEQGIAHLGIGPLEALLSRIEGVSGKPEMLVLMAELSRIRVPMPMSFYVDNDARQSDQYISYIAQSGLGLPDRDWYLSEADDSHQAARAAYREYIGRVMALADYPRTLQAADSVYAIEKRMATAHWDRVQNRQRELTYNKLTLTELAALSPQMSWIDMMSALGIGESTFIAMQPSYLQALGELWGDIPLAQWRDYTAFKLVDAYAPYLSEAFVQAHFAFNGQALGGLQEIRPRWKRGVDSVDEALGEVLGRLYVDNYFQEDAKRRMDVLVENLREAFRVGIDELDWMTPATRLQAQDKLSKFTTKIGYPDEWKDYSALEVSATDLVGNVMRSSELEHQREVDKLGGPINRAEWFMTPYTVNAYYNPSMNEVVFPAAILQPPFFNVSADDAVNYGAIGAVIGHEFSHGFDDQGRKSDGDGNLRDWWTEADAAAFTQRAQQLVAQYDQFEVLPGKFLNGAFTLGENIGDLSGLAVAYKAYRLSLAGREAPLIDGLTGDQRFFMGWAQIWRRQYRDEDLAMRLTNDPHAHSEARSNGVLRNFDAWYEAFDVQPADAMYLPPADRVKIW